MVFLDYFFKDFFIEEQEFWSSKKLKRVFLDFLNIFSLNNKGFGVLKNEKGSFFIFFKDFFVEEKGFWSSKKQKRVILNFFFVEEQRFWSSKKRKMSLS